MVTVAPGFYFCHAFDLGSRPPPFRQWARRVSLPVAPSALRYRKVTLGTAHLFARVKSLRTRFTESVANTTLYRGHLERNRQGMLNAILAGIALLSLAQVSRPISDVLAKFAIMRTESQLNQLFVVFAVIIMLVGSWRYAITPTVGIWFDNFKRWRVGRKTRQ
jgi:hypothetical protein